MAVEVTVTQPVTGSVIAVTDHTIVVDVTDPGSNPAREFNVVVNAVVVLTCVAGVATYTDPGYSAAVTVPSIGVERYTVTKTTDWSDPLGVEILANYREDGTAPGVDAPAVEVVACTVMVTGVNPYDNQPDTRTDVLITLAATSTSPIQAGEVYVNEGRALQFGIETVWGRPDFLGVLFYNSNSIFANISHRRLFDPDIVVPVQLVLTVLSDGITAEKTISYNFHTQPRVTKVLNPALFVSALDRPFQNLPALDILRTALLGALRTRISPPPSEVLVYDRISKSSLRTVRTQFKRPDLDLEVSRIVPEDLASVEDVDAALSRVDLLWESAVSEARSAGIDSLLVNLIVTTHATPYPQERVGAAAALVFAMAGLPA